MHQSSLDKMTRFRDQHLKGREGEPLTILDVGSQDVNGSYRPIFDRAPWTYRGADAAPGKNVDIVLADQYAWREVPDDSYDVVISGQAFEHIALFWIPMLEIARILKPGGLCCLIVPSSGPEHRYPLDCWRFYPDGLNALAQWAQLIALESWTQWHDDPKFTEESNAWHDSVLVCKKPPLSGMQGFVHKKKMALLHRLLHRAAQSVKHEAVKRPD